eukprot:gene18280-23957_t
MQNTGNQETRKQLDKKYSMSTVAIIGTAGRGSDKNKMTKEIFFAMISKAEDIIQNQFKLEKSIVKLISGGSAWADHVAVRLYINSIMDESYNSLCLYLPCHINLDNIPYCFENNKVGNRLNSLHSHFSKVTGINSIQDIKVVRDLGKADYIIAFTWGDSNILPKDGGTLDTWSNSLSRYKVHVPLNTLMSTSALTIDGESFNDSKTRNRLNDFFNLKKLKVV